MTMRLKAELAYPQEQDFRPSFVSPSIISSWIVFLRAFKLRDEPDGVMPNRHRRNIGYRLQLMEFECALILANLEVRERFPDGSTLHATVHSMKCQQFVVLTYAVIEGIGAHLFKRTRARRGQAERPEQRVRAENWQRALLSAAWPDISPAEKQLVRARLERLVEARHRVHLDRFESGDALHFDEFYEGVQFKHAGAFFNDLANAFNARWPEGSCLVDLQEGRDG